MRLGNIFRNRTVRSARKPGRPVRGKARSARRQLVLESLEQRHLLSVVTITADDLGGNGSNNSLADEFRLLRNGTDLEVYINGNLSSTTPLAGLTGINVLGSSDSDTLIIDLSGGTFAVPIYFDGEALGSSLVDLDQLVLVGNPGSPIGRMSYFAGALFGGGADDGQIVIDPDDNAGPGAGYPGHPGAWNGDEMFITFQNLSPVTDTVPAAQLDIFATNASEIISIVDGPVVGTDQTITVRSDSGTFEAYSFANKTRVTVNSLDGSDVFNLNYHVAVPGLQFLDMYGNEFTGGTLESDDAKGETFNILATGPGPQSNRMYGQNGSELYTNAATKYLDAIQSNVQMHGQAGLSVIDLSDINDPTGDNIQFFGDRIIGASPGTIELYFATIEDIRFEATSGDDVITILSTFAPFQYRISGGPGSDVFRVGSYGPPTALNWAPFGTGVNTIGQIKGQLTIIPGPASDTGVDSLYVDDSGGLLGYTTAQINDAAGGNVLSRTTTLLNFDAAAPIRYEHTPGGSTLENLYIHTSKSADTLTVNATTADHTEINLGPGNDASTLHINGDGLGGDNVFLGGTGADRFVLNITSDLGSSAILPLTGLRIEGNDPAGNSSLRDVLEIVDIGGGARNIDFAYQAGGGLLVSGFAVPVDVRTMETVIYAGDGWSDDAISVTGTSGDDAITVAPTDWDSALVFLGGDPWDGPNEGDFFDQFPGLAGGGTGPDLAISGAANLTVDTAAGGGDQLYVYAPSEDDLVDPATTIDPFGFGTGVIVPGFGAGNAYDTIFASDNSVTIVNSSTGTLLPLSIVGGSLVQTDPNAFGLVVNAGFEAAPAPWGLADDINVDPSGNFAMLINGGDPVPAFAPNGDSLNLFFSGPIDIWADKSTPTQVWIGTTGSKGVAFSSIENLVISSAAGIVNLYGDANDPAIDQNDVFDIVGTGYQSLTVSINGSAPIHLTNVTQLNVFGDDALGTPSVGPNDVDTLNVTPYADNTPQGWGVQVFFDEGNPDGDASPAPDPIIYNALPGISENIAIVPTGPGTGQLRVTNAADGSLISVINFVGNTGFIINGNDGSAGDTDSLTLAGTTGDDTFIVVDDQNVNVVGLYSVQFTNFAVIRLEGGDGYDEFHVNPSALQVVVDGGTPDGAIQSDGDVIYVWPGLAPFHLVLGPDGDNGTLQVTGAGAITFDRIEGLGIQGVLYTLPDLKEPNDSLANATILGSIPHLTIQDLTIHSEQLGTTNDDYFQVTARDSGGLIVNVVFTGDNIIGNQLGGQLSAELLDGLGNVIATGTMTPTGVRIAAPVVSQQRYYIRVFSTDGDPNTYTLEVENFAAPTPTAVVMHPAYDSGRSGSDSITNMDNPVVLIQAWLSDLAAKGIPVLTAVQAAAGLPGLAVEVFVNGVSAGYADPFGPSNNVFAFALPSGLLSAGLAGGYSGDPTAFGWLNFISAAVRVIDAQTLPASATRELGTPLALTYDPNTPGLGSVTFALAASSDSGVVGDNITNLSQLTFQGQAEINTIVRIYANGSDLVGVAVTGSDQSDGILGNGLGVYSVTTAPLAPGVYTMYLTVEDVAGNVTDVLQGPQLVVTIDNVPPQRPTIDLQDADDTGWSDLDNVTIGDPTQGPGIVDVRITGEPGTSAVIKDGEVVIDSFTLVGPVTIRTLTLAEGPHPLTAEVTDVAGNRTQSEQLLVLIDYTAPAPASISLAPYSDSGTPGDGITNVSAPAFTGLAEANARVRLYVDDGSGPVLAGWTIVQSDESDGDPTNGLGIWEITVEPLADGEYTVWAEVEDQAGNISLASDPVSLTIDTTAPQRPTIDLQDADDTGWSDMDNVTIGDPSRLPSMGIVDVRVSADLGNTFVIKDGNTVIVGPLVFDAAFDLGSDGILDGFGLVTIDFNFVESNFGILAEGPHPLTVEAMDGAGNVAQSEELLITLDYTPPAASTPVLASYADTGIPGDNVTAISSPAFTGRAEANARVRLYVDNGSGPVLAGQTYVHSDESDGNPNDGLGVWEITVEPLADGTYTVWTEVEDLAGNVSDAQDNLALATEIVVDTTPPQIPTIDLQDSDDTGWSDKDNVTIGDPLAGAGIVDVRISAEYNTTVLIKDGEVVIDSFVFDAAFDATDGVPNDNFGLRRIDFNANQLVYFIPAEGPHPLTVEAIDAAGNVRQSEQLLVTIDFTSPAASSLPDMLPDSDTGAFSDDNVTRINNPAFRGTAEANSLVRLYVVNGAGQTQLVGQVVAGSDESDGDPTDGRGIWEITIEPLDDGVYTIYAVVEDQAGNLSLVSPVGQFEIDTYAPNTPYLDLVTVSDSGRSNVDNITNDTTPVFTAGTSDPNALLHIFPTNLRYRIYDRTEGSGDVLLYDSGALLATDSITTPPLGPLAEGVHNLKLEVEDRAGNISADFLLTVVVDVTPPPVFFGESASATDGLAADSDTGLAGLPALAGDRITSDTTPTLWGRAEADSIIRLYADVNGNNVIDAADAFLGQTTAVPLDGNQAEPNGYWEITSAIDLNDPLLFPRDGRRTLLVQATDVPGNQSTVERLNIWIDTQGPRVESVYITSAPAFDLFNPKPTSGPTPLVTSLSIVISDLPARAAGWLYEALARDGTQPEFALDPGHFSLVGDANGVIPITGVTLVPDPVVPGQPARATIILSFAEPLPDDRFTLTISDELRDPAGNRLDGESNAVQPLETPLFPSGDGTPGGSFVARFTVDSRPEVGVWGAGSVWVDTNGNGVFDPDNPDYVNRDLVYTIGFTSDDVFAGNFTRNPGDVADGFDKLAAYGRVNGQFRWIIDVTNDGVPDINLVEPAAVNGLPIAGRFDDNDANGDEVGVVTAFPPNGQPSYWYFDTNHDYQVDYTLTSQLRGYPIVGDFDGDGFDDLATFMDDVFYVDLANGVRRGWDGVADYTFRFGFIGILERPVAADMDQDGFDDIGLWVPTGTGQTPTEGGEWYFLISNGQSILNRIVTDPIKGYQKIDFSPKPLGQDLYLRFGNQYALPVVGNFDPPVVPNSVSGPTILGTNGDDVLEIYAGNTAANWTVKLNNVVQSIDPAVTELLVDLGAGNDQVIFVGTAGDDTLEVAPGSFVFSGTGYTITVLQAEKLQANLGNGDDSATLVGTAGNDTLTASPGTAQIAGPGLDALVTGAESITASAGSGGSQDLAMIYDSAGDDTATITAGGAILTGTGYRIEVNGFDFTHLIAKNGGQDSATFHGTIGEDAFVARPDYSTMTLFDGTFFRAKGFDQVEILAPAGNESWIKFVDGLGNDTFVATPTVATMSGPGYQITARQVAYVHAYARYGGVDTASLTGSEFDDRVVIDDTFVKVFGEGYFLRAKDFEIATVDALGGNDSIKILDTPGDDNLVAEPGQLTYRTRKQEFRVQNVATMDIRSTRGGTDTAALYDSPYNDTFTARPNLATLTGEGYSISVTAFDYVLAYSRGGRDTANLTGSPGDDQLVGDPTNVRLLGNGFVIRAKNFANVFVSTGGGRDQANVKLSSAVDSIFANGVDTVIQQGLAQQWTLRSFARVQAQGVNSNDVAEVWNGQLLHQELDLNGNPLPEPDATALLVLDNVSQIRVQSDVPPQNDTVDGLGKVFKFYW